MLSSRWMTAAASVWLLILMMIVNPRGAQGRVVIPPPPQRRVAWVSSIRGGSQRKAARRDEMIDDNNNHNNQTATNTTDDDDTTTTRLPSSRRRPWYSFRVTKTPFDEVSDVGLVDNVTTTTHDETRNATTTTTTTTSGGRAHTADPDVLGGNNASDDDGSSLKNASSSWNGTAAASSSSSPQRRQQSRRRRSWFGRSVVLPDNDEENGGNVTTQVVNDTTTATRQGINDNNATSAASDTTTTTTMPKRRSLFWGRRRSKSDVTDESLTANTTTTEEEEEAVSSPQDEETANTTRTTTLPDLISNNVTVSAQEENSSPNNDKRRRRWMSRFRPKNFSQRLLRGDARVLNATATATATDDDDHNSNNNDNTTAEDVFVFSSRRGETVRKVHATTPVDPSRSDSDQTKKWRWWWPFSRVPRDDGNQPLFLGKPDHEDDASSTGYSSWNPYRSSSSKDDDVSRSINVTATDTASVETKNQTATKNATVDGKSPVDDESSSLNATETTRAEINATASPSGASTVTNETASGNQTATDDQTTAPPPGAPPGMVLPPGYVMAPGMYGAPPQTPGGNNQIVYMGGQPYRVLRPGSRGGNPGTGSPTGRPPSNGMVLAEILGALLATAMRLWIVTWLTRRLATQEETIEPIQRFVWERVNDRYERDVRALQSIVSKPPMGVSTPAWKRRHVRKQTRYTPSRRDLRETFDRTVVVLPVEADKAGNFDVPYLTHVTSFLIQQHRAHFFGTRPLTTPPVPWWKRLIRKRQSAEDGVVTEVLEPKPLEIVLLVNSPGGGVATYGLAAAQVKRLAQEPGILLTVSVDHYAASGGYMIASQAHQLLAAPFATVGSIGVIMEGLNFHEIARKYGVQPITIKSGANKNPLSTYGAVTSKDEKAEEERLARVHTAFKQLVVEGRPALADTIEQVGDGSVFLGQEALDLQMVDRIQTSEEYIMEKVQAGYRVLRLHRSIKPKFSRRIHLNPLDVLPHIRTWLVDSGLLDRLQDPSLLMTLSSAWEMGRYVLRQYLDARQGGYEW